MTNVSFSPTVSDESRWIASQASAHSRGNIARFQKVQIYDYVAGSNALLSEISVTSNFRQHRTGTRICMARQHGRRKYFYSFNFNVPPLYNANFRGVGWESNEVANYMQNDVKVGPTGISEVPVCINGNELTISLSLDALKTLLVHLCPLLTLPLSLSLSLSGWKLIIRRKDPQKLARSIYNPSLVRR